MKAKEEVLFGNLDFEDRACNINLDVLASNHTRLEPTSFRLKINRLLEANEGLIEIIDYSSSIDLMGAKEVKAINDNARVVETVTIEELTDSNERFASGKGELTLYEGMPDKQVLKIINNAFKKANGASFLIKQLPDFNEYETLEKLKMVELLKITSDDEFRTAILEVGDLKKNIQTLSVRESMVLMAIKRCREGCFDTEEGLWESLELESEDLAQRLKDLKAEFEQLNALINKY